MKAEIASTRSNEMSHQAPFAEAAPVQFHDVYRSARTAERDLAAAVLRTAIGDLELHRYARGRRGQRQYWQAYDWVAATDWQWPFSFVNICDLLHLSPDALRVRLLHPRDTDVRPARAA
jgi:hypothetical protein